MKQQQVVVIICSLLLTFISCNIYAGKTTADKYLPITDIFPPQTECHTHGSNIVYLNNSLMTVWFHGDGERTADNVKINASVLSPLTGNWSTPFEVAYNGTGTPDINPALQITENSNGKVDSLSLYWMKIYYHDWGGAEIHKRDATVAKALPLTEKSFKWQEAKEGKIVHITYPDNFTQQIFDEFKNCWPLKDGKFNPAGMTEQQKIDMYFKLCELLNIKPNIEQFKKTTGTVDAVLTGIYTAFTLYVVVDTELTTLNPASKFFNLGWETRSNIMKIQLPDGKNRLLLPVYSDHSNISMVAYSDDNGLTWTPSPIVGRSNIQPTLVQTDYVCPNGNKRLLAYMRNNGGIINFGCSLVSHSDDNGTTWSPAAPCVDFTNSSTSLGVCRLNYGDYKGSIALVCNPDNNRKILELGISQDNGKTWTKKILEKTSKDTPVKYEYPSIVQVPNGDLYISFTHTGEPVNGDQTIGVVHLDPAEVLTGAHQL